MSRGPGSLSSWSRTDVVIKWMDGECTFDLKFVRLLTFILVTPLIGILTILNSICILEMKSGYLLCLTTSVVAEPD